MRIGLGLGVTLFSDVAAVFMPGLSNANTTGGTAVSCVGSLLAYAPNAVRWGCLDGKLAVLIEDSATSKLAVKNANPTVVSDLVSSAWAGVTLSIVTDAAELAAAKLSGVVGTVLKIEADGSVASAAISLPGVTGSTNPHVFSAYARVERGQISLRGAGTGTTFVRTDVFPGGYARYAVKLQPGSTSAFCRIYTETATTLAYVALPNMTEGASMSSVIVQNGTAATRAADLVTAPITSDVTGGVRVRGTFRLDAVVGGYDRVFQLDNGNSDNRLCVMWDAASAKFAAELYSSGVRQGSVLFNGPALGEVIEFDLTYTPTRLTGMFNGVSVSEPFTGAYTPPTIARLGNAASGVNIPARLLCSKFLVSGA